MLALIAAFYFHHREKRREEEEEAADEKKEAKQMKEAKLKKELLIEWSLSRRPEEEDVMYVANAQSQSYIVHLKEAFAEKDTVRLFLPGTEVVYRAVVKGGKQHVCSHDSADKLVLSDEESKCSKRFESDVKRDASIHPLLQDTLLKPYAP